MSVEIGRVEAWLFDTLSNDPALGAEVVGGFFSEVASGLNPDEDYPIVVWRLLTPTDVRGVGAARVMIRADYVVVAIDAFSAAGSYSTIGTAADRIDAVLHGKDGTADDGTIFSCTRREPFASTLTDQGIQYRELGGVFRIQAQV